MSHITQLPNNCHIGKVTVFPPNWQEENASIEKDWRIQYRFYDPSRRDEYPKGFFRIIKGMNEFSTLEGRQHKTKKLISNFLDLLKDGFNPHLKAVVRQDQQHEVLPSTPIMKALEWAWQEAAVVEPTKKDMKSQLKFLKEAGVQLNYLSIPIGEIRRRHIKALLKKVEENRPIWNNGRFNKYRANLQTLFKDLLEIDAIETNPIKDIKKKEEEDKIRETLTREERRLVDHHLRKKKMMRFRLYIRIFFHTGIRSTELLRIKVKDVNLEDQLVKVTIRKGRSSKIVYKTIKNIAKRYWRLALKGGGPEDYIFHQKLKPGIFESGKPIDEHQISRRWNTHIKQPVEKGGLGLTADFYAFKHGNTTEMIDVQGAEVAAGLNSHSGTAMVRKIYDTKRVSREHEKIKLASNEY